MIEITKTNIYLDFCCPKLAKKFKLTKTHNNRVQIQYYYHSLNYNPTNYMQIKKFTPRIIPMQKKTGDKKFTLINK